MSQKFNYFGFKAIMQYALKSALWFVFETTNVSSLLKKNFSSNFSLEEYGENLKIVKSKTQRILRNLNN